MKMLSLARRGFLAGASAALAMTPGPHVARAQAAQRYAFGLGTATVLSDGHMMVPLDRLAHTGADAATQQRALIAAGIAGPQHRFAVNITLLELGGKRILIDAGMGGTWIDTGGKLSDGLAAAGIDPKSIDHVVFTHAHPDHIWGVVDDFDNSLRFPNARYTIPAAEFVFWMSATAPEAAGAAEGVTAGARRCLKLIEPKLSRVPAGAEILPGLIYIDAKGHTPGQCAVLAQSGGATVLIAADTIFHAVISVQFPLWQPAQDMDGASAARTRQAILDLAVQERALVIAYHVTEPGAGRIERRGAGAVWVPA
jgi:glyoxylase-like metal-dependent hydrolase (beta-lactamase superfamily II)